MKTAQELRLIAIQKITSEAHIITENIIHNIQYAAQQGEFYTSKCIEPKYKKYIMKELKERLKGNGFYVNYSHMNQEIRVSW